jgi:hypothetical protein
MGMAVIVRMVVAGMGVGAHEGLFYDMAKAGTLLAMPGSEAVSISSDKKNGSEGPLLQKLEDREKLRDEGLEGPGLSCSGRSSDRLLLPEDRNAEGGIVGQFDTTALRSD